jgi:CMP-N-acetylneuraminic acid synthetase
MSALYGIAIVTRLVYPNSTGGAEIHTYYIAKELAKSQNVILISEGSYPVSSQRNLHHLYFENGAVYFISSIVLVLKS